MIILAVGFPVYRVLMFIATQFAIDSKDLGFLVTCSVTMRSDG